MNKTSPHADDFLILTGGGTAGHILPNLALIPYLEKRGLRPVYIGSNADMDRELIETMSALPFYGISTGKLRRYLDWNNIWDFFRILRGVIQSFRHLVRIKPRLVFAKGGFVAVPVVWAAWLLRIPCILHESDYTPGLANRLMLPFAKKICLSFKNSMRMVPAHKAVFTGIPVRPFLLDGSAEKGRAICRFPAKGTVLLILGGSQGSRAIDEFVWKHLDWLSSQYLVIHVGRKRAANTLISNHPSYAFFEFIKEDLPHIYACADLVISRSGANTLFELLALRKPALLIPLPKEISRGDQVYNAQSFQQNGLAEILPQENLEISQLMDMLRKIHENRQSYIDRMEKNTVTSPAETIADLIHETIVEKNGKKLGKHKSGK